MNVIWNLFDSPHVYFWINVMQKRLHQLTKQTDIWLTYPVVCCLPYSQFGKNTSQSSIERNFSSPVVKSTISFFNNWRAHRIFNKMPLRPFDKITFQQGIRIGIILFVTVGTNYLYLHQPNQTIHDCFTTKPNVRNMYHSHYQTCSILFLWSLICFSSLVSKCPAWLFCLFLCK